jgi:hypothetical protein
MLENHIPNVPYAVLFLGWLVPEVY